MDACIPEIYFFLSFSPSVPLFFFFSPSVSFPYLTRRPNSYLDMKKKADAGPGDYEDSRDFNRPGKRGSDVGGENASQFFCLVALIHIPTHTYALTHTRTDTHLHTRIFIHPLD
jgi:hypothetical protein